MPYKRGTDVNVVEFEGVSKSYAVYQSPGDRLKELATLNRIAFHRDFWALRDLSFVVRKGETFCRTSPRWLPLKPGLTEKTRFQLSDAYTLNPGTYTELRRAVSASDTGI